MKPYQVELIRHVWANADEGVISRTAHEYLHTLADETLHKSRASVIFFLRDMTNEGFLVDKEKPGQGGYHSVWTPSPDFPCEEAYMREMAMRMVKSAEAILNVTFMVKQARVA